MGESIIKKRKISLDTRKNHIDKEAIKIYLERLEGIRNANYEKEKSIIAVEYELQKINFEEIERQLSNLRIELSRAWKDRLKRGMAKFTEQNELDNLSAPTTSCCNDPKGSKHKSKSCH